MVILEKVLSEKTERIYKEIEGKLTSPVAISKMDPENQEEVTKPCYFDAKKREYYIKLDVGLEDSLFENALLRNMIYCLQMEEGSPLLEANPNDHTALNVAAMINSVVLDINLEQRLKDYQVTLDEIDNMRMGDLFLFLRGDMSEVNRDLYNKMASLQVVLLYYTAEKRENVEQIMETFQLSDPDLYEYIERCIQVIDKYGCDTVRGQMRCMRKIALAMDLKEKAKIYYEGKATLL